MASSTPCFQPKPACPIPSGFANAAISAATTPTRMTTIPICLLDMAAGRLTLAGEGHVQTADWLTTHITDAHENAVRGRHGTRSQRPALP